MTSPNEIMKTWPHYRVAVQKDKDGEVLIRDIRCRNIEELHDFLRRLHSVTCLSQLEFMEIHEMLPGGRVAMIQECDKPWPKTKEIKVPGILSPRIPREEPSKALAVVIGNLVETATTVVGGTSKPDEWSRSTIPYKIEVA